MGMGPQTSHRQCQRRSPRKWTQSTGTRYRRSAMWRVDIAPTLIVFKALAFSKPGTCMLIQDAKILSPKSTRNPELSGQNPWQKHNSRLTTPCSTRSPKKLTTGGVFATILPSLHAWMLRLVKSVEKALYNYALTLPRERQFMLSRYRIADVAHRIVGVGSVGNRAYLALLFGNGDTDPSSSRSKKRSPQPLVASSRDQNR